MKEKAKAKRFSKAKFLKLYFTVTQSELAKMLGVSQPAIAYYAKKFGLVKTKAKKLSFTK
jgi:predicted transcriptional regulator